MIHNSLPDLILNNKYSGTIQRVLMYLLKNLDYNNRIKTFRQSEIAEKLDTSQPNVSKALKILEKDNIIFKKDFDYFFNEKYIKGAGDDKEKNNFFLL